MAIKKQLVFCGLAAAVATAAFATTEKLLFYKNNVLQGMFYVESIDRMRYLQSDPDSAFTELRVEAVDGSEYTVSLSAYDEMRYNPLLPPTPVEINIEPHHKCATLHITSYDDDAYYRVAGVPVSLLDGIDHEAWADVIMEDDINYINSVADFYEVPLSSFQLTEIFDHGSQVRDWFPDVIISDNTPIALIIYTATIENDEVKVLTEPRLYEFTTKQQLDLGVNFNVSVDATSTSVTVNAEAIDSDIPFVIEMYSEEQVALYGLPYLTALTGANYEQQVYNYGLTWDSITYRNSGSRTYTNCRMGDKWVAVAFGLEYGVVTTSPSIQYVTIPEAVVTDDCTFDVTTEQVSPTEMKVNVVPSSDDTRYVAFLLESSRLGDNLSDKQHVANRIYWYNYSHQIVWENSDYVHTGASTLSTHDDIVDGIYLEADKDYTVLICGIKDDGTRTTAIKQVSLKTTAEEVEEFTFDVAFTGFNGDSNWTRTVDFTITPSDQEAQYVVDFLREDNTYADLSYSDEAFIKRYVDVQGQYLSLFTGTQTMKKSMSSSWSTSESAYVFSNYILLIFGYNGQATTPLYAYRVDANTGEGEQVRGPELEAILEAAARR